MHALYVSVGGARRMRKVRIDALGADADFVLTGTGNAYWNALSFGFANRSFISADSG